MGPITRGRRAALLVVALCLAPGCANSPSDARRASTARDAAAIDALDAGDASDAREAPDTAADGPSAWSADPSRALLGEGDLARAPDVRAPAPPLPVAPLPSLRQIAWHERPYHGLLPWATWDPSTDVRTWARTAKDAGMAVLVLGAPPHVSASDASRTTDTSATAAGDAGDGAFDAAGFVRALSDACLAERLGFGVAFTFDPSPASPEPPTPALARHVEDVLTSAAPVAVVSFDAKDVDALHALDWGLLERTVRRVAPDAVLVGPQGPDARAYDHDAVDGSPAGTCWALWRRDAAASRVAAARERATGHPDGTHYVPAEARASLSVRAEVDGAATRRVRSADELLSLFLDTVGRGATLRLALDPDADGRPRADEVGALRAFRRLREATFDRDRARGARVGASSVRGAHASFTPRLVVDGDEQTAWAADDGASGAVLELDLQRLVTFDVVTLREPVALGQRAASFRVEAEVLEPTEAYRPPGVGPPRRWTTLASGDTVGVRRILPVTPVRTGRLRVHLLATRGTPMLAEVSLHLRPPTVDVHPPGGAFDEAVDVTLTCHVPGSIIVYTLDGTEPDEESSVAVGPVRIEGSCRLRARAFADGKSTPLPVEVAFVRRSHDAPPSRSPP